MSKLRRILGGERQRRTDGERVHSHLVKVTAEQEEQLQALAAKHGAGVVKLMVEATMSLADEPMIQDRRQVLAQLAGHQRLLANLANNMNQITRRVNSGDDLPAELTPLLEAIKRLYMRMDDIMDRL